MSARRAHTLDDARFALADRIARRVTGSTPADPATRAAVSELTASADPGRAERLAVRAGEPGALVERLAVWALHRAADDAVVRAGRILDADGRTSVPDPATHPVHERSSSTGAPAGSADTPADADVPLPAGCR